VTFSLWVFVLIRLFLAKTLSEIIIELILLLITVILGLLLIRDVFQEIHQRERIESLATQLQTANTTLSDLNANLAAKVAEQTKEIRHAFDLEKQARRDLEKLNETKDQFIMITQHHLRTPVTSIRWNLEAIRKGTYGEAAPAMAKALADTDEAAARLTRIVDDFLSITALKAGGQILDTRKASLLPLVEDVLKELRMDIEQRHLAVAYPTAPADWPEAEIDAAKMREVVLIILENAVRYNRQGGRIDIATRTGDGTFEANITNTGIGIAANDRTKIFGSLFFRSAPARQAHPVGMGVGLSVARAIVRAHHGDISIESAGDQKGATVKMELPLG